MEDSISFVGHTQHVTTILLDNNIIISGGCDYTVRMWDIVTHEQVGQLKTDMKVNVVALDPIRRYLVVGCNSEKLNVYNLNTMEAIHTVHYPSVVLALIHHTTDGQQTTVGHIATREMDCILNCTNSTIHVRFSKVPNIENVPSTLDRAYDINTDIIIGYDDGSVAILNLDTFEYTTILA